MNIIRTYVLANQKGGVGKTTTAINLATAFGNLGKKVLLIDLDPQGNASTGLGISPAKRERTIYDVLSQKYSIIDSIIQTSVDGVTLVSSEVGLSGIEPELASDNRRAFALKDELEKFKLDLVNRNEDLDFIIIDCPPSLSLLTIMGITAADSIIVPLQCEFFALEGLSQLIKTVYEVKKNLNPELRIEGVVLTMYDKRNRLSLQVAQDVKSHFNNKVYEIIIPRNVRVSESPSHGLPVLIYDSGCSGSQAYKKLAFEILDEDTVREAV